MYEDKNLICIIDYLISKCVQLNLTNPAKGLDVILDYCQE